MFCYFQGFDWCGAQPASPICSIIGNRSLGIFRSNIQAGQNVFPTQGRNTEVCASLFKDDRTVVHTRWCNNAVSDNTVSPLPVTGPVLTGSADPDMI